MKHNIFNSLEKNRTSSLTKKKTLFRKIYYLRYIILISFTPTILKQYKKIHVFQNKAQKNTLPRLLPTAELFFNTK